MSLRYLLTSLIMLFAWPIMAQTDSTRSVFIKTYTPEQLQKDIDYVHDSLTLKDPNLYWYISKSTLDKKFDSLKRSIKTPLTALQFRHSLLKVLACVGDGHMNLTLNGDKLSAADRALYAYSKMPPIQQFDFKVIGKKLYVINNLSYNKSIALGAEIIAIDGEPAARLIDQIFAQTLTDGYNQTYKTAFVNAQGYLADAYSFLRGFKDTLTFTYKQSDSIKNAIILTQNRPPDTQKHDFTISTTTVSDSYSPAFLDINQMNRESSFDSFFKLVKDRGVKCVILDMRFNQGGDATQMIKILSYFINKPMYFGRLKMGTLNKVQKSYMHDIDYGFKTPVQPDSNHFDGKLYVIVGGFTFSAAALLADNLQALNRATIVGQETRGGRNGCIAGVYHDGTLPNSGLLFRFGLVHFDVLSKVKTQGHGLIPDIPLTYTLDDYLTGKNLEKDWILKDIKDKHILR